MKTLKPCPFCGTKAKSLIKSLGLTNWYEIGCWKCEISFTDSKEFKARRLWNKRRG